MIWQDDKHNWQINQKWAYTLRWQYVTTKYLMASNTPMQKAYLLTKDCSVNEYMIFYVVAVQNMLPFFWRSWNGGLILRMKLPFLYEMLESHFGVQLLSYIWENDTKDCYTESKSDKDRTARAERGMITMWVTSLRVLTNMLPQTMDES